MVTMTDEQSGLPKPFIPGLIPTMNNTGFMTEALDAYSQEFVSYAGSIADEVLDIGCAYGVATLAADFVSDGDANRVQPVQYIQFGDAKSTHTVHLYGAL